MTVCLLSPGFGLPECCGNLVWWILCPDYLKMFAVQITKLYFSNLLLHLMLHHLKHYQWQWLTFHFYFFISLQRAANTCVKKEPLLVCNERLWKGHGNMLSLTLMSIKGCLNINSDVKPWCYYSVLALSVCTRLFVQYFIVRVQWQRAILVHSILCMQTCRWWYSHISFWSCYTPLLRFGGTSHTKKDC